MDGLRRWEGEGGQIPTGVGAGAIDGITFLDAAPEAASRRRSRERLRTDYLDCVSHDLRSPISAITLHAQMLERSLGERGFDHEQRHARIIGEHAWRLAAIVQELLDLSAHDVAQLDLHVAPADLGVLVRASIARLPPADAMRMKVELEPVAVAEVDAGRIERVIANLLGNACKYASPATPITVRVGSVDGTVRFTVTDHGPGLEAEELGRVFDKYQRGSTADGRDGLGLGLYSCRLIVEAHGGRIGASSTPGVGSTFAFTLAAALSSPPAPRRDGGPQRVLVVDDDQHALAALGELLGDEGVTADCAVDGVAALACLAVATPDALVVDVQLPGMSGVELVHEVRRRLPTIPVIMMTGYEPGVVMAAFGRDSGVRYVGKPIHFAELLRALDAS